MAPRSSGLKSGARAHLKPILSKDNKYLKTHTPIKRGVPPPPPQVVVVRYVPTNFSQFSKLKLLILLGFLVRPQPTREKNDKYL